MDLAEEDVHRALAYVVAINRQGVEPTAEQLEAYARRPSRVVTHSGGGVWERSGLAVMAKQMSQMFGNSSVESYTDYLLRLQWATQTESGIRSTPLGQAVARALDSEDAKSLADIVTTVIDPDDPFAYARTLNTIASLTGCLVVDPYLKLDQLIDLRDMASVDRILTSDETTKTRTKPSPKLDAFRLITREAERPQVRVIPGSEAHDRYVIPASGRVLQLSTSLNSVGSRLGVVTQLDDIASATVRTFHDKQWETAELLNQASPVPKVSDQPADGELGDD